MIHATIAVAKDKGIPKEVYLSIIEDSWKAVNLKSRKSIVVFRAFFRKLSMKKRGVKLPWELRFWIGKLMTNFPEN